MKKRDSLRVPVTAGLKDIYSMDMRLAYQAATLGRFNVLAFGRMAAALSVVRTALELHRTPIENAIPVIDAAMEVLLKVRDKGDETGIWEIAVTDQPTVLDGIGMAEQCIGTLDVALLADTAARLLRGLDVQPGNV